MSWSEDEYYEDFFGGGYSLYIDWYAGMYEVIDYENSYLYWEYEYINETKPNTYTELHNNLGSGWSLGFSSIEINNGKKYLHLSNGESYEINITSTAGDSNLKNYTLRDIRLENDSGSFTNRVKNSQYALYHKNGNVEYFADDGRLLGIKDRFGNTIKFEHTTINNHPVINKITDSVNRVVNISYQNTSTGKKVVITAPDSTTIQYILEPISGHSGEYKLVKKIDRLGRETVFNYSIKSGNFSFFSKSDRNKANYYANLTEIHYPTGAYTKYSYQSTTGNLGNQGSYVYYRIKTREDIENSVSFNKDTYTYNGNYTGYPSYDDPASLPSSFTYGTTVTDNENLQAIYTFNYKHLKTREETKDGSTLINTTDYEYDSNKLLVKAVRKDYGKTAGQYMLRVENFVYDTGNFGDLVGYWDTRAERNSNHIPMNDEHKTTYTYNSAYHYVTGKIYKKDANTTIKEEYVSYADNKKIEWYRVKENDVLKEQTWYNYDSY
ncbi:MAG: hypothetical protein GX754_01390 [Clostridiaceae bacterium]|nr:hypothetical protein [Clostridiaceae bacterium]